MTQATYYDATCNQTSMTLGVVYSGAVNSADCQVPSARDRYTFTTATQQAVAFTLNSTSPVSLDLKEANTPRVTYGSTTAVTTIVNLLGPGTYTVDAVGNTSNYSLSVSAASPNVVGCSNLWAFSGVNQILNLANTDCTGSRAGRFSDPVLMYVGPGQTLTATMSSVVFDPYLRLLNGFALTSAVITEDDNGGGGTTAKVVYTNPTASTIGVLIEATSALVGATGDYVLTTSLTPAFPNLRAPKRPLRY
jgi:hypothetical protein